MSSCVINPLKHNRESVGERKSSPVSVQSEEPSSAHDLQTDRTASEPTKRAELRRAPLDDVHIIEILKLGDEEIAGEAVVAAADRDGPPVRGIEPSHLPRHRAPARRFAREFDPEVPAEEHRVLRRVVGQKPDRTNVV